MAPAMAASTTTPVSIPKAVPTTLDAYIVTTSFFLGIATITLGLRLWVRMKITRSIARNDYVLVLSNCLNIFGGIFWLYSHNYAARFPPHSEALISYLSLREVVVTSFLLAASALSKVSIASFFLHIAQKRWHVFAIRITFFAYLATLLATILVIVFRCGVPINGTRIITANDCPVPRDIFNKVGTIVSASNSVCDWAFASVPLHMVVTSKRLDATSKLLAVMLIILAVSASFVSFARVPLFARGESFEPNTIYNTALPFILSVVENAVAVSVISAATLRPLLGVVRNGSLARRPSLAFVMPQKKQKKRTRTLQRVMNRVRPKTKEKFDVECIDWEAIRGIGILPNVAPDEEAGIVEEIIEEKGLDMPKKPSMVRIRVTRMESIDEVMNSEPEPTSQVSQATTDSGTTYLQKSPRSD